MSDLIDRQAAIDALMEILNRPNHAEFLYTDEICKALEQMPSAQPEEAIPVAWLEERAKWFEGMDNPFAKIEANNIRVMIKKWRSKKDEQAD